MAFTVDRPWMEFRHTEDSWRRVGITTVEISLYFTLCIRLITTVFNAYFRCDVFQPIQGDWVDVPVAASVCLVKGIYKFYSLIHTSFFLSASCSCYIPSSPTISLCIFPPIHLKNYWEIAVFKLNIILAHPEPHLIVFNDILPSSHSSRLQMINSSWTTILLLSTLFFSAVWEQLFIISRHCHIAFVTLWCLNVSSFLVEKKGKNTVYYMCVFWFFPYWFTQTAESEYKQLRTHNALAL